MNDTRVSSDFVSRGLPIQLYYDGRADDRTFTGPDPVEYAKAHRVEILGELAGMVLHWIQRGQPQGSRTHRCRHWAQIVGGILEAAGFPEFLANAQAAAAFDGALDELAALAEAVVQNDGPYTISED